MRRWQMGDPLKVLERKEEGTHAASCRGCAHLTMQKDPFEKREVLTCAHGLPIGQRCNKFQEKL